MSDDLDAINNLIETFVPATTHQEAVLAAAEAALERLEKCAKKKREAKS